MVISKALARSLSTAKVAKFSDWTLTFFLDPFARGDVEPRKKLLPNDLNPHFELRTRFLLCLQLIDASYIRLI